MRVLDRFELIDKIGRKLQSRMTTTDINTYLAGHGVRVSHATTMAGSKWVYVKELLAEAGTETIVRIADELEIPHAFVVTPAAGAVESSFWLPGHFRLFISHLSSFAKTAGALRDRLREYGISAFVAHTDIKPTKEWQREIENALFSMDALTAVIMPGFKESDWTDQEVGVAIGRDVLVVPIMKGQAPYGLFGKYQGLKARQGLTVGAVAHEVYRSSSVRRGPAPDCCHASSTPRLLRLTAI